MGDPRLRNFRFFAHEFEESVVKRTETVDDWLITTFNGTCWPLRTLCRFRCIDCTLKEFLKKKEAASWVWHNMESTSNFWNTNDAGWEPERIKLHYSWHLKENFISSRKESTYQTKALAWLENSNAKRSRETGSKRMKRAISKLFPTEV